MNGDSSEVYLWHEVCCLTTCVYVLVAQSCLILCNPMDTKSPLSMEFSRQEHNVGCHSFLQGIFPTERSNTGLELQAVSLPSKPQGKPDNIINAK